MEWIFTHYKHLPVLESADLLDAESNSLAEVATGTLATVALTLSGLGWKVWAENVRSPLLLGVRLTGVVDKAPDLMSITPGWGGKKPNTFS